MNKRLYKAQEVFMPLESSSHSTPLEAEPVDVLEGADQIYEDEGVERTICDPYVTDVVRVRVGHF